MRYATHLMVSVARQLKKARLRVGERQVKFAARFGVHQSIYNRWENQKRKPTAVAQALIHRVLAEINGQSPAS
jgi:DNA-binding transcriptional regulator YiaG